MKAVAFCVGLLAFPWAAGNAQTASFELVPGVLVDPARDALYLMSPGGGLEGLSISSGGSLWQSDRASKPLGLIGDLLVAQVEEAGAERLLEIVLLDTQGAGALRETLRVELPQGVRAAVDEGMGRSFVVRAELVNGAPFVAWTYTERYAKGIAPRPEDPLEQVLEVPYSLDLQAARLVKVEPSALAKTEAALPTSVQTWMTVESVVEPPSAAGEVIAATQVLGGMTEPSGRIVLKRWDRVSGAPLPDVELLRGPHILQLRSADGRHLLVAERVAPDDFEEYEWSVFSLESGALLGQLRHHQSHARFFVAGATLVFEEPSYGHRVDDEWIDEPRRLRGAVLGSGSTVWERPLRDTAYRGPYPP